MVGYFDEKGNPKIKIIIGGRKNSAEIDAIFDTGCSGYLVLPILKAIQLGLELVGVEPVKYADGRIINQFVFGVLVNIDGEQKIVPATLTWSEETLVGISLFRDYSVKIDFKNKEIEIQKITEK